MTAAGFVVAVATGWLVSQRLLPGLRGPAWAAFLFRISLGVGIAAGLLGLLYLALLVMGEATRQILAAAEGVLLAAVVLNLRRRRQPGGGPAGAPSWVWAPAAALAAALALYVAGFVEMSLRNPAGDWDAWAIWNLRARFLVFGDFWHHAWSPLLDRTHPEYPLLLPLFVARGWTYAGVLTPSVPIATALLFQLAVIGLVVSAASLLRGATAGLLTGLVLVANQSYLVQGPSQYADIPLSFFVAGATAVLLVSTAGTPAKAAFATGLLAGLACWTKDEGAAFFVALVFAGAIIGPRAAGRREALRRRLWFAAGAAPGFGAWLGFKLMLAPVTTTLLPRSGSDVVERLTDPERYAAIATACLRELAALGSWWAHPLLLAAILAAAFGFDSAVYRRREFRIAAAALALLLTSYVAVYLLTPMDVNWQLTTSLGRLYAHLWPAAVLLYAAALRLPEPLARVDARGVARALGRHKGARDGGHA